MAQAHSEDGHADVAGEHMKQAIEHLRKSTE